MKTSAEPLRIFYSFTTPDTDCKEVHDNLIKNTKGMEGVGMFTGKCTSLGSRDHVSYRDGLIALATTEASCHALYKEGEKALFNNLDNLPILSKHAKERLKAAFVEKCHKLHPDTREHSR
jgi:predicted nucleic acid-binding protein